jgi:hypothetical protein
VALYEAEDEVRALTIGKLGARNGE